MAIIYTFKENKQFSQNFNTDNLQLAELLIPNQEGGKLDIIRRFPWTLTPPNSESLKETPYIRLKEFYLLDTYINQLLKSYNIEPVRPGSIGTDTGVATVDLLTDFGIIRGGETSSQLYEGLYDHVNPTGFEYWFPYFENPQTNSNTWAAKSTYDRIIQLQRTFAPFQTDQIKNVTTDVMEYFTDVANRVGGPIAAKALEGAQYAIEAILDSAVDPILGSVPQGLYNLLTGNVNTPLDAATAAAPGIYYGAKLIPSVDKVLNIYEAIAAGLTDFNRAKELIDIALQSPMSQIDSDPVIDKPHVWSSTTPRTFSVSFPLYNINSTSPEESERMITRNWELCHLLTYQNLYNKRNLYTGVPPVFYEIEVPGAHYTKAGYVSSLTILNIGNIRNMLLPVGDSGAPTPVNVPDAYMVNLNLVDFFMPSRNFQDTLTGFSRDKVTASFLPGSGRGRDLFQGS